MVTENINKLTELRMLARQLDEKTYAQPREIFSGSTLGQHFRHILEFYTCLLDGVKDGEISYDKRKRDLRIENDIDFAENLINEICLSLFSFDGDYPLKLVANFSADTGNTVQLNSSLYRELAYTLDHAIHHMAIIKMGLSDKEGLVSENFGIAPSTIRHRKNVCAQ